MTTFFLANGVLGADTKVVMARDGRAWDGDMDKIRVTPLFVVTGAGSSSALVLLGLLPNLLAMRWLGRAGFVFLGRRGAEGTNQNICVVWRTGAVWAFNLDVRRRGCLVLAKVRSRFLNHMDADPVLKGGSGAEAFSCEDVAVLGVPKALAIAATQDPATGPDTTLFDLHTWRTLRTPTFLHGPFWRPWANRLTLLRTSIRGSAISPEPNTPTPQHRKGPQHDHRPHTHLPHRCRHPHRPRTL